MKLEDLYPDWKCPHCNYQPAVVFEDVVQLDERGHALGQCDRDGNPILIVPKMKHVERECWNCHKPRLRPDKKAEIAKIREAIFSLLTDPYSSDDPQFHDVVCRMNRDLLLIDAKVETGNPIVYRKRRA